MSEKSNPMGRRKALELAKKHGLKLNTNTEVVNKILNALDRTSSQLGHRYCPCSVLKAEDTICPCKEFRDDTSSKKCHCGLYIRE